MSRNQYGLSRNIPTAVQFEIRRRSKNGCVICRAIACDYEHIEPPFSEAREHNPAGICLLCIQHHGEVTRGRISKDKVMAAYKGVQLSSKLRPPFYHAVLSGSLKLGLGNANFDHMPSNASVLLYDGESVLSAGFVADEVFGGSRPTLTGSLYDLEGKLILHLEDNLITVRADGVDVKLEGNKMRVIDGRRALVLELTFDPPGGIRIDRLRMRYKEVICEFDQTFGVTIPDRDGSPARFTVSGIQASGATSALSYVSDRQKWAKGLFIAAIGGKGILLPGVGLIVAEGAGSMLIPKLERVPS